jgi:hypothetical protein
MTPSQLTLSHVTLSQVTLSQVTASHVTPSQVTPSHVVPPPATPLFASVVMRSFDGRRREFTPRSLAVSALIASTARLGDPATSRPEPTTAPLIFVGE